MTKDRKRDMGNSAPLNLRRHRDSIAGRFDDRIVHDAELGQENVEMVDSDWADFERALREFRERRVLNASMENLHHRPKKGRRVRPQAFYPCPPPTAADMPSSSSSSDSDAEDPIGYIDTLVSI